MSTTGWMRAGAVAAVGGALLCASAGAAMAGTPGNWTPLTTYSGNVVSNIDVPTVLRVPGGAMQAAWRHSNNSTLVDQYRTRSVLPSGAPAGPESVMIGNWGSLISQPRLRMWAGKRLLLFGSSDGTHGGSAFASQVGHAATSSDGTSWTVEPGTVTAGPNAFYAGYGQDIVSDGHGGLVTITTGDGLGHTVFNHLQWWLTSDVPFQAPGTGCCTYDAAVERDLVTNEVWGAYYSNSSNRPVRGVMYARMLNSAGATAVGPFTRVQGTSVSPPSSPYDGSVSNSSARIAMAARVGGGVYLATPVGYPTTTGVRIVRLDTGWTTVIPARIVGQVSIAAAPGGRMWVSWIDRSSNDVVKAVRSNPAGTAFGRVVTLGTPAGGDQMWHLASDGGTAGKLDVVATLDKGGSNVINLYHTQAQAGLSATAAYVSSSSGRFIRVTVTDAGAAVAGATVRRGSTSATTNSSGVARLPISYSVHGAVSVVVSKPGYSGLTVRVRVP